MRKIKFAASNLLLVMMCFMFAACPPDPDPELDIDLVNTLKMYKWEYYYVDDFSDTDYGGFWGTSTYRLYFMDNNSGFEHVIYKDHDTSLGDSKDSYFMKFTYRVSGNTVRLRYENGAETYTYTYKGSYLESDDGTRYIGSKMTQSDKDFVDRKAQELEEEEENEKISSDISDYVTATGNFYEEDLIIRFTINTELDDEFPSKTFKYGIEYGYGNYNKTTYCEMSGKSSETFRMSVLFDECALYMESYTTWQERISNGEQLTQSEKDLLKDLKFYIEKYINDFQARIFVEFNGERYYVYNGFNIKFELDGSYSGGSDDGDSDDENNQTTGTVQGHAYVDLGLSVKWATCNVGASNPEDYGDYYAWGETTTKSDYDWDTYKWCKGKYDTLTKYCTNSNGGTVDNRTTLTSSDDVATVKWGSKWRMPTKEEMKELVEDCTWTRTTQNGVEGMKVIGSDGNSIFLPAAGNRYGTDFDDRVSDGNYWSATLDEDYGFGAYFLYFDDDGNYWGSWGSRGYGLTVRPVTE